MWMNRRRGIYGVAGVVIAAVAVAFALNGRRPELKSGSGPQLPVVTAYNSLPPVFNQRLERLHADFRSRPNDAERARKLARLYHANGLYHEARECCRFIAATSAGLVARDHYYLADI